MDAEEVSTFLFGQTAPDAVRLPRLQGVLATLGDDGARCTDRLRLSDPSFPLSVPLPRGMVEGIDVHAAAGGGQLPVPAGGQGRRGWQVGHGVALISWLILRSPDQVLSSLDRGPRGCLSW